MLIHARAERPGSILQYMWQFHYTTPVKKKIHKIHAKNIKRGSENSRKMKLLLPRVVLLLVLDVLVAELAGVSFGEFEASGGNALEIGLFCSVLVYRVHVKNFWVCNCEQSLTMKASSLAST